MSSDAEKYASGKIYKLMFDGKCVYVGSTRQSLDERKREHDAASRTLNSDIYKFMRDRGPGNVTIELHQNYPCKSKYDLEQQEKRVIMLEKDNPYCLNIQVKRSIQNRQAEVEKLIRDKERQKYEEDHKEELRACRYAHFIRE